jgi:hypothetical protein
LNRGASTATESSTSVIFHASGARPEIHAFQGMRTRFLQGHLTTLK